MSDNPSNMTCAEFQSQLPELIGSGANASEHPHIQSCELCRALLADLETIAEAARQLLPVEEPPDDLWAQIELKIKGEDGDDKGKGGDDDEDEEGGKTVAFEPA
jgi:hypothetical protein